MGKISILPDTLCNQIAAGEVVERPAAVVKELMENSLDAGCNRISLTLLQGGRKEVKVVDDGIGMEPDDALLALERHATSKLKTADQLQAIRSLGFRGEALPSIASVSRFELITREPEAVSGTRIAVDGGKIVQVQEAGTPPGTTITVRDLFFNLPARRKFLRSVETELAHISDQFIRIALAHPEIRMKMMHQGRTSYDFPRAGELRQRAAQVFGQKMSHSLLPFSHNTGSCLVRGLLGPPELQRTNTRYLFAYVNNRPVRDRSLNHAILSAYDTLIPKGRYPAVVIFINLPADQVDVNVHPTKREIRFRRPSEILGGVRSVLSDSLGRLKSEGWNRPFFTGAETIRRPSSPRIQEGQQIILPLPPSPNDPAEPQAVPSAESDALKIDPAGPAPEPELEPECIRFSQLPVLAQLESSYILLQAPDGLIFVDQHAAHERIVFDRLTVSDSARTSQRLTHPCVVELLPLEFDWLKRHTEHLLEVGFEIEPFGGTSFVIHAVPGSLDRHPSEKLLRDFLDSVELSHSVPKSEILAKFVKTVACHQAIRFGQKMNHSEIAALLTELDRTRVSFSCPHGRPLWWKLSYEEIGRVFKR